MTTKRDLLFGSYTINEYIRFMRVRDSEHAKERKKAESEGYYVR